MHWTKHEEPIINYKDKNRIYQTDAPYLLRYHGNYYLFCEERSFPRTFQHTLKDLIKLFIPISLKRRLWKIDRIERESKKTAKYIEHSSGRYIVRFSSKNPLFWNASKREIIAEKNDLGVDICSPKIYKFGRKYYLLAAIFDGKTKTIFPKIKSPLDFNGINVKPVLEPSTNKEEWDMAGVIMASILKADDGYVGFYEARNKNATYGIGMAYSKDLKNWKKFKDNPIIKKGEQGSWYDRMVCAPYVFSDNNNIYLFFTAYDWEMNNCIAVAKLKK
jgi:hypothetical protein